MAISLIYVPNQIKKIAVAHMRYYFVIRTPFPNISSYMDYRILEFKILKRAS